MWSRRRCARTSWKPSRPETVPGSKAGAAPCSGLLFPISPRSFAANSTSTGYVRLSLMMSSLLLFHPRLLRDEEAVSRLVPGGAARPKSSTRRTARRRQGRVVVERGDANPCRRAPFCYVTWVRAAESELDAWIPGGGSLTWFHVLSDSARLGDSLKTHSLFRCPVEKR